MYLLHNTALCICSCFALVCWCTRQDLRLLQHVELTESLRWEKGHRAKMEGSYNESIKSAWLFEMAFKVFKCLTLVKRKRLKDSGLFCFTPICSSWIHSCLFLFFPFKMNVHSDLYWDGCDVTMAVQEGSVGVRVSVLPMAKVHHSTLSRIKNKSVALRRHF